MGEKIVIDMAPVIAKLKRNLEPLAVGAIRSLKGTGPNEGKFRLIITLSPERDISITVDVAQALLNKHYFDNLTENIYGMVEQSDRRRYEQCRITV